MSERPRLDDVEIEACVTVTADIPNHIVDYIEELERMVGLSEEADTAGGEAIGDALEHLKHATTLLDQYARLGWRDRFVEGLAQLDAAMVDLEDAS